MRKFLISILPLFFICSATLVGATDIRLHNSNYFVVHGANGPSQPENELAGTTRFQMSIAADLLNLNSLGIPVDIVGAVTTYNRWDIAGESAPMLGTDYAPEVWAELRKILSGITAFRLGFRHESTGEAGPESLGWNTLFFNTDMSRELPLGMTVYATPEVWAVLSEDENTEGIGDKDHTGLWVDDFGGSLPITLVTSAGSLMLELGRSSGSLELRVDLIPGLNQFEIFLQGFRGQKPYLIAFDEYQTTFAAGIALVPPDRGEE
ncbi:MAG: phospholipase A [Ignavibacteria bacterium]|nr:phospholipase A [Ignavibacteria bacterium]